MKQSELANYKSKMIKIKYENVCSTVHSFITDLVKKVSFQKRVHSNRDFKINGNYFVSETDHEIFSFLRFPKKWIYVIYLCKHKTGAGGNEAPNGGFNPTTHHGRSF